MRSGLSCTLSPVGVREGAKSRDSRSLSLISHGRQRRAHEPKISSVDRTNSLQDHSAVKLVQRERAVYQRRMGRTAKLNKPPAISTSDNASRPKTGCVPSRVKGPSSPTAKRRPKDPASCSRPPLKMCAVLLAPRTMRWKAAADIHAAGQTELALHLPSCPLQPKTSTTSTFSRLVSTLNGIPAPMTTVRTGFLTLSVQANGSICSST